MPYNLSQNTKILRAFIIIEHGLGLTKEIMIKRLRISTARYQLIPNLMPRIMEERMYGLKKQICSVQ